jgi:hypothetical protein
MWKNHIHVINHAHMPPELHSFLTIMYKALINYLGV